ncbi:pseudouridine synthase [Loktanella salsilacus]|uniref:pseudouridine synthase n=1 Tax=Loktanella salsilacus TaxID=195913 RepID=UPI003736763E
MSNTPPEGDRIAKVLSRAGIASRRDAERMITDGRVSVNGKTITSPALNVTDRDRIVVDGKPVGQPEAARLWLYHKPAGLVTSARDEKDRATVFDNLPGDMPRVMSVGRLDINSEGLLLLTNDGGIKRRLELPSTGWLRRYRVRINGSVSEARLDELRKGITVDGVDYQPMLVTFDRQQGANAWLTISIREGKNREIRRAMEAVNATVNRLIRVSYGPFQLGKLAEGAVEEVKGRVLREQLGLEAPAPQKARVRKPLTRVMKPGAGPAKDAPAKGAAGRPGAARAGGPRPAAPKRGLRKD